MGSPTTRVLALLELLQSRSLTAGSELARRLDIHPRTLRRYVGALEALGIPVVAERGRDGGYRLLRGFKLPPMMFDNDEALALALGLAATRDLGSGTAAAASALAKLERVLPDAARQRLRAVADTVALHAIRARSNADGEVLAALSIAAQRQQAVQLTYVSSGQSTSERRIDPYALAFLGGNWYVVGHCHLRRALRSFRVDRIGAVAAVPHSFGKPAGFDATDYLLRAFATLPRAHRIDVLLHVDIDTARTAIVASIGVLEPAGDATVLHAQADDLDWMARELARLPFAFTIRSPQALSASLRRHATMLANCA